MRSGKFYLLILLVGIISFACSELQNDLIEPVKVSVHGSNAMMKSADTFHGKVLINKKLDGCRQCHAQDLSGGTAQVACSTNNCHPTILVHTKSIMDPSSNAFHGKFIAGKNWNMTDCRTCHGVNYAGGVTSPTCNTCHSQPNGPEACNTCHGDFSTPSLTAPPRALNNAIETTDPGVGAHTYHLTKIKMMANVVECKECHLVPTVLNSPGHLDNLPKAELTFSGLTNAGPSNTSYEFSAKQCFNSYCHGNFSFSKATSVYPWAYTEDAMKGNNYSPKWTKVDGTEGKCGTCHGLPPTGHQTSDLKSCATCHQGVINNMGAIIDAKKHINGKINVFGN
jgi:predicted CxxxxCH...CXXCH cytochrome family protein